MSVDIARQASRLWELMMMKQQGYGLMGAAFEVYNELGYGMAEEVYQQSLEFELQLRSIPFLSKAEIDRKSVV